MGVRGYDGRHTTPLSTYPPTASCFAAVIQHGLVVPPWECSEMGTTQCACYFLRAVCMVHGLSLLADGEHGTVLWDGFTTSCIDKVKDPSKSS